MTKEIQNILAAYHPGQQAYALATVVYVEGSSYRRMGARMLVAENGQFTGGISGGCLEGDALKRARTAILTNKPSIVRYDTSHDDQHQIGVGLGCNGIIDVLFMPIDPENQANVIQILKSATIVSRSSTALISIIQATDPSHLGHIYNLNQPLPASLLPYQAQIHSLISTQVLILSPDLTIFYEHLPPPIHIYIHGHQYDIYPLIHIIQFVGWEYTVVAPGSKLKPGIYHHSPDKPDHLNYDNRSVALLMSHNFKTDKANLTALATHHLPYIGILGPKVRSLKILDELQSESLPVPNPDTLHYPMGLDLGAQSPEEIALSIIAEIQTVFANRPGTPLKHRTLPIYDRNNKPIGFI